MRDGENLTHRIVVTDQELAEYTKCALRHLYRFRYGIEPKTDNRVEMHLASLRDSLLFFFQKLSDRKAVQLAEVIDAYDRALKPRLDECGESIDAMGDLMASGRILLKRHFDDKTPEVVYLGTNVPYEREIGRAETHIIVIKGTIDALRVTKDRQARRRTIDCVRISLSPKHPSLMERANSIEIITDRLGLGMLEVLSKNRMVTPRSIWYSIQHDVELETPVSGQDLKISLGWVANIAFAIHHRIYYPQYEYARCGACPYRRGCDPKYGSKENLNAPGNLSDTLRKEMELD